MNAVTAEEKHAVQSGALFAAICGIANADAASVRAEPSLAEQFAASSGGVLRYGSQPVRPVSAPRVHRAIAVIAAELAEARKGFNAADLWADDYSTWCAADRKCSAISRLMAELQAAVAA